ncbi:protein-glutamate methylesterase/protein-glutamine glutaminase [Methermicoccus shengliensis]|uniref:Protein-glutamate methylesterase/protein-glutamine glutaminase n=1 Tax=Methermicoccus shengliensis TaxID=660064 RepID=A0A832RTP0_9EURY|nr:chemotaxis response regulator protein-glutamate methylesterase [Methermicoccus shengliensis]KUK04656.1 MAG: Chemotaxis response regulator protein-glutamate methylesterase [Euryarchaeota archaeon 55_53]KUK30783.1 MAG: Chemotaxis response regulator protein-glutamate methylesterase [Methanosarcinales archeaon 56_1174]MDI3487950.1 two-component system, chemotaxis family, protein-glutamate methylesterase/glutaminase [Methanosarcinales archaeon]MDN5295088.1 two-component system, chemotaxis family,
MRALVVDDSALIRMAVVDILTKAGIEVVDAAKNGREAVEKTIKLKPDVITLDINMPVMDGLTALKLIMERQPTPVVMLSSLTQEGARETFEALKLGAVDFIPKPHGVFADLNTIAMEIVQKVKTAATTAPNLLRLQNLKKFKGDVVRGRWKRTDKEVCVLIGSSTGGPSALELIIPRLPADIPSPVFIVQHMPPHFTQQLAERLNDMSEIEVKEAEDNERVKKGTAYIAPGGLHMKVRRAASVVRIKNVDGKPVNAVKPSVDVTAEAVVSTYGGNVVGAILTGMGNDGAYGMKRIKGAGGLTIASSEDTCVVFGMPKAAIEMGAITSVKPVYEIAEEIVSFLAVKLNG